MAVRLRWVGAIGLITVGALLAGVSPAGERAPVLAGGPYTALDGARISFGPDAATPSPDAPTGAPSPNGALPTLAPSAAAVGLPRSAPRVATSFPAVPVVTPTIGELAIENGQDAYLGDTSRYRWIVLQEGEVRDIPAIRAANPNTKVLAYQDAAVTEGLNSCGAAHPAAGVSYCYAAIHHPEWFLTDSRGNRLTYCDFPSEYVMDVGNPGYQAAWRDNVAALLERDGWDGVYMDDVNTFPGHCLDGRIARYTDAQYGLAMVNFVRAVSPPLRNAGLMTVANVAADPWTSWHVSAAVQMAGYLDGWFREYWQRWRSGSALFTDTMWSSLMSMADRMQSAGAALFANTYGTMSDTAAMVYARASWLLACTGSGGGSSWDAGNAVPYHPAWTTSIGVPLGARYAVGAGWRRDFTGGIALVNPSSTKTQTFALTGTFMTSTGARVTGSITLQPGSAAVLSPI